MSERTHSKPRNQAEIQPKTAALKAPSILNALRNIRTVQLGIQSLVALSLALTAYSDTSESEDANRETTEVSREAETKTEIKAETNVETKTQTTLPPYQTANHPARLPEAYSRERYHTVEARTAYLFERYGIIVEAYDEQKFIEFVKKYDRTFPSYETAVKKKGGKEIKKDKYRDHSPINKITPPEGGAKGQKMLSFLGSLCQICDSYPGSIFSIKGMTIFLRKIFTIRTAVKRPELQDWGE